MTRVTKRFCIVGLLVLTGVAALVPVADAGQREVGRGFFGVMYDSVGLDATEPKQDGQHGLMARSGVETVRVAFVWDFLQPNQGDAFDFEHTDRRVRLAARHGLEVLPVMLYAPPWARVYPDRLFSPPETAPYLEFLRASIQRYGSRGSFWRENPELRRVPITDWQVWNEPNIRGFWDVPRSNERYGWPEGYVRLMRASHRVINRTDPRARSVLGGIVGSTWVEVRRLYEAGIRNAFDAAAVHIYPQTERRVLGALKRTRRALDENGGEKKPLFLTETAFPASKGRVEPIANQRQETRRGMAKRLGTLYELLVRARKNLRLQRVFWYTWATSYNHPTSNFEYSGLLKAPGGEKFTPMPALKTYRRMARRFQGCVKNSVARCR